MTLIRRSVLLFTAAFVLCQCGVPTPPVCRRLPLSSRQDPAALIDHAEKAWEKLQVSHGASAKTAMLGYNAAVTKLLDHLRCGPGSWDEKAARLGTVIHRTDALLDPEKLDALVDARSIRTKKLNGVQVVEGLGVPAVGWVETSPVGTPRKQYALPNGIPYHLNVILNFDGTEPRWEFRKRWKEEEVEIEGRSHLLAGNWSAPNEFYWHMCQLDDLLVQNVILPDRFTEETGVYFLTPYDPKKIPLVFVHGLVSSPDAFKNTLNVLMPQKWFRDHYQVWLYNYPTGNPWIYSSKVFRDKMREVIAYARQQGPTDRLERMVVVCHSMGGLVTRSSVTHPGNALYDKMFTQRLDSLEIPQKTKDIIRAGLLYEPLKEPSRVVMMAVPHRGSPIATWGPSVWLSKLIRLPKTLTVELLDSTVSTVMNTVHGDPQEHSFSSINSLSPNSPVTAAMADLPLPKSVVFHSIIGDRGKGDTPNSSDGVVPYWSSHVDGVASEKIVSSGHGVPDCPEASEELARILELHLGGKSPALSKNP